MEKTTLVCLLVLYSFVAFTAAALTDEEEWQEFKTVHHKLYQNKAEEATRFQIFKDNLEEIREHNRRYERGETTFKEGVNQFTDMTAEEFKRIYGHGVLPQVDEDEKGHGHI
ncbi:cathepsin L-like proteinase [Euwallacea fornicatus]|uniref:cathepsin L-like proteinase n=1 Tax=Euwallacea fornicatus TaxID=995702 RepID=UPI00338D470B